MNRVASKCGNEYLRRHYLAVAWAVVATNVNIWIPSGRAACSTARLCWRSISCRNIRLDVEDVSFPGFHVTMSFHLTLIQTIIACVLS